MIASLRRIRRMVETQTAYQLWQLETLERLGAIPPASPGASSTKEQLRCWRAGCPGRPTTG